MGRRRFRCGNKLCFRNAVRVPARPASCHTARIARECRAFSGVTVVTNAPVYYTPRAAAGASGARHSLRPLSSEGQQFGQTSDAWRRENADICLSPMSAIELDHARA
jgi:hypothetical protein